MAQMTGWPKILSWYYVLADIMNVAITLSKMCLVLMKRDAYVGKSI